ncbi:NUDIX hydrolase [Candidatus Woesearchaeota archaeon]|nr:NUDIX hydrolase [Candidatus Woesearchaeota archaeon]
MEGVMVVIRRDGRFLLGLESKDSPAKGHWRLLGGKVEAGESPEECVHRELSEEAGIRVKIVRHLGVMPGTHRPIDIHMYLADYLCGSDLPKLDEVGKLQYFSEDEIGDITIDPLSLTVFEKFVF